MMGTLPMQKLTKILVVALALLAPSLTFANDMPLLGVAGKSVDISTGLTLHYRMEDNAASTVVTNDGSGANGTASANTSTMSTTGKILLGFDMDDTASDDVDAGSDLFGTGDITVCWWVNAGGNNAAAYNRFFTNGKTRCLHAGPNGNRVWCYSDAATYVESTGCSVAVGTFSHWCFTRATGGNGEIFKDGASCNSGSTGTPVNGTVNTHIGSNGAAAAYYDGILDDVRVYSRVLTLVDIQAIYNGGTGTQDPN